MPSPIAHIAVGTIIGAVVARHLPMPRAGWILFAVCLFFSIVPDFDLVAGFLFRDIGAYHNQFTHSPIFGAGICLLATPLVKLLIPSLSLPRIFGLLLLCYGLHIVMDYMTYGRGLKLLWPFSEDRFRSPVLIFYGVRWSDDLFTPKHFITLANELIFAGICLFFYRKTARKS